MTDIIAETYTDTINRLNDITKTFITLIKNISTINFKVTTIKKSLNRRVAF